MSAKLSTIGLSIGAALQLMLAVALIGLWNLRQPTSRLLEIAFFSALVFSFLIPFLVEKLYSNIKIFYLIIELKKVLSIYKNELSKQINNNNNKKEI